MEKVLVATDGSETSDRAVLFAAELAKQGDASLLILTVAQEPTLVAVPMGVMAEVEGVYMTPRDVIESAADEIVERAATQVEIVGVAAVERLVRFGSPARIIVQTAEEEGADIIVMGRRGLGDFGALLLGSVTHKVMHIAKLPVITVP
jgi:nucleotide-binding universal stress UspA family protein